MIRFHVVIVLCIAQAACASHQQPPPSPQPLGISLNGALGFSVGSSLERARNAAALRGDQLRCRSAEGFQFCTPWRPPGDPGYYTVTISGDSVTSVSFQLRSWPEVAFDDLMRTLDRIGVSRAGGPMTDSGRGFIRIWTNPSWTRQVVMLCDSETDVDCDLSIARADPETVKLRVSRIRARQ